MPINERKLLRMIMEDCSIVNGPGPAYKKELLSAITNIIQVERLAELKDISINVKDKIRTSCETLGEYIFSNTPK